MVGLLTHALVYNTPVDAYSKEYIVARPRNGLLWYEASFDRYFDAVGVAQEVRDGVVLQVIDNDTIFDKDTVSKQ